MLHPILHLEKNFKFKHSHCYYCKYYSHLPSNILLMLQVGTYYNYFHLHYRYDSPSSLHSYGWFLLHLIYNLGLLFQFTHFMMDTKTSLLTNCLYENRYSYSLQLDMTGLHLNPQFKNMLTFITHIRLHILLHFYHRIS